MGWKKEGESFEKIMDVRFINPANFIFIDSDKNIQREIRLDQLYSDHLKNENG